MDNFYDSLEENSSNSSNCEVVPLYDGEVPKLAIASTVQKKVVVKKKKPIKSVSQTSKEKSKKTYLSIYQNQLKKTCKVKSSSSDAVCDILSSRKDSELDLVSNVPIESDGSESEYDKEFYDKFIRLQVNQLKKQLSVESSQEKSKKIPVKSTNPKHPFFFKSSAEYTMNKLDQLKKRQTYGMKVSIRNRVKMEEEKCLKKINQT